LLLLIVVCFIEVVQHCPVCLGFSPDDWNFEVVVSDDDSLQLMRCFSHPGALGVFASLPLVFVIITTTEAEKNRGI
jgi:hypothetical protein